LPFGEGETAKTSTTSSISEVKIFEECADSIWRGEVTWRVFRRVYTYGIHPLVLCNKYGKIWQRYGCGGVYRRK
jgi:hypothetical protein